MIFTDHINHQINLKETPKKIVSLVPSQTELLFDLGLDDEVVGITKFCVHPKNWHQSKKRIGGTKNINFEKIDELQPDLIIANKEENQQEQIEELRKKYQVWTSDIKTLDENFDMIEELGRITNKENKSLEIIEEIKREFQAIPINKTLNNLAIYLIWKKPYMAAGVDTFIHSMLLACGLVNSIEKLRYPILKESEIKGLKPDYIFLSSEPYPFKEKDVEELKKKYPKSKVILVDGEMFSWYGSRLKYAPKYFIDLVNKIS